MKAASERKPANKPPSVPSKRRRTDTGPQFVQYFGPVLDALRALGGSGSPDEVVDRIAMDLKIPDAAQNELLPSGEPRYRNRVHWARFYLAQAGFLDSSKRGVWSLTDNGRATRLTQEQALQTFYRVAKKFQEDKHTESSSDTKEDAQGTELEPEPSKNYQKETLEILLSLHPNGFEQLSQRLLREAGFIQVIVTGRSGDEGIDGHGTLQINPLVSFKVLFQCKRYRKSVTPSHVRDFRGAMAGRADKGIIITTGTFSAEARREAARDGVPPIELIDGEKLVGMLESLELGLKPVTTYQVDHAFFDDFRKE